MARYLPVSGRSGWSVVWVLLALALWGCNDKPYCFSDCDDAGSNGSGSTAGAGGGGGSNLDLDGGEGPGTDIDLDDDGDDDECDPAAEEICDGVDNDCDHEVDEDINFNSVRTCGDCQTDCTVLLANVMEPRCVAPDDANGSSPGTCTFDSDQCAQDYYDLDPDQPGCEYYCDDNPNGENTLDFGGDVGCGRDDDCDGVIDEDVDTCADVENCGRCGRRCVILHGTPRCESSAESGDSCTESNTSCVVESCEDGYHDANANPADGCEYRCNVSGPEVCDGVDNDCDGLIDNADPDLEDAEGVGDSCSGDSHGECASAAHAGVAKCIGGTLTCCDAASNDEAATNPRLPATGVRNGICESESGAQVLSPAEVPELCNGLDDDCDGSVDDEAADVGSSCGTDDGICARGTLACVDGAPVCQGATGPGAEVCNGLDDDCDGVTDGTVVTPVTECSEGGDCGEGQACALRTSTGTRVCATPTPEVGAVCDAPPAVTGGTSPCQAGASACSAGQLVCVGSVRPDVGAVDSCGVDADCDGVLSATDLTSIRTCGTCSNDCTALSDTAIWACEDRDGSGSSCYSEGCLPGWYDSVPDDGDPCDAACVSLGTELCNGRDDDCDGSIDEDPEQPSTASVQAICSVPSMASPGCVPSVTCSSGAWVCSFPTGICGGSAANCAAASDNDCDGLDNDCNGVVDVSGSCGSDVGACAHGTWTCSGMTAVCQGATSASPELCNGIDDNCDGVVDGTVSSPVVACNNDGDCAAGEDCADNPQIGGSVCAAPPSDVGEPCNVPPTVSGGTTPCRAGVSACSGGQVVCSGSVGPASGAQDSCGVDADCDGVLSATTLSAITSCGSCDNDCTALSAHANWSCVPNGNSYVCQNNGCHADYHDIVPGGDPCDTFCVANGEEICNDRDDDCDGTVDDDPALPNTTELQSLCDVPSLVNEGCTPEVTCVAGGWVCSFTNAAICGGATANCATATEVDCDGLDNDCDGVIDRTGACGSNVGTCSTGTWGCNAGSAECLGDTPSGTEVCNDLDDDCDGVIDGTVASGARACTTAANCNPGEWCAVQTNTGERVCAIPTTDVGVACDVPPSVPADEGVSACAAGVSACVDGAVVCNGAVGPVDPNAPDTCGRDENCDGILSNTILDVVTSCGSCGNDCATGTVNTDWSCDPIPDGTGYQCVNNGCLAGWHDLIEGDGNLCDTFCIPQEQEYCNGVDDDCDGDIDEEVVAPTALATLRALCGIPSTNNSECQPTVTCTAGAWACSLSNPQVCRDPISGALDCDAAVDDTCDNLDNDCDSVVDNDFVADKGQVCTETTGSCLVSGVTECNAGGNAVECSVDPPVPGEEICDGQDNDCDGSVDETYLNPGTDADDFVRPDVVALSASGPWVFAYEASRPNSTAVSQGTGNGYVTSAPSGEGLDATLPCSAAGRLPWTNVTGTEVEQACSAMGGRICRASEWKNLCHGSSATCDYGFQTDCETAADYDAGPYCNLAPFDVDPATPAENEDALVETGSPELLGCASSWDTAFGNTIDAYDTTGNVREFARCQKDRTVCADAATCATDCCAGTSTTVSGPAGWTRLCGTLSNARRLSGQPCSADSQCCRYDANCTSGGSCVGDGSGIVGICRNSGVADADACVATGMPCTDSDSDGNCNDYASDTRRCCDGAAPGSDNRCGDPSASLHPSYPLYGGSFRTEVESSATCDYEFFKVDGTFSLFDSGFRCCFDANPSPP